MVTNMITMEDLPQRYAVEVNRQWYDPVALDKWLRTRTIIPHTRRPPTSAQREEIARKAAEWAAQQGIQYPPAAPPPPRQAGWLGGPVMTAFGGGRGRMVTSARKAPYVSPRAPQPQPAQPNRPVYFRRHIHGRRNHAGARYKYYRVTGATTAELRSRDGSVWRTTNGPLLNEQLLIERLSRIDVSLDFTADGGGHWEQLRLQNNGGMIERWSTLSSRHLFYRAIQARLPPTYSHLWQGYT